jgi:hypothetical protein
MQDYRVFVIGPDGHVIDRFEFKCRGDKEAEKAKQLLDSHDIELWHPDRKFAESKRVQ